MIPFLFFWILAFQNTNCCKIEITRKERARREIRGAGAGGGSKRGRSASLGLLPGCIMDEGIDYRVVEGDVIDYRVGGSGIIKEWQSSDLTKEGCATLAASLTPRGPYWTYKASKKRCWVKNTNSGRATDSGVVSGNMECGRSFAGCSLDIDVDRSGGEEGDKILEWQGLTLDQCKNLAASTDRGQFWTYKRSERSCIVKETALEEALEDRSGVMSGVKECGTSLPDFCLIETGWTYIGAKSKYFNLDGTGPDEVLEESRAENTQDCAIYAYKVSKDHFDISKPAYWTYEADSKVCSVVLHKGYRSEAEGHVSGSSDCKIARGRNFKKSYLTFLTEMKT